MRIRLFSLFTAVVAMAVFLDEGTAYARGGGGRGGGGGGGRGGGGGGAAVVVDAVVGVEVCRGSSGGGGSRSASRPSGGGGGSRSASRPSGGGGGGSRSASGPSGGGVEPQCLASLGRWQSRCFAPIRRAKSAIATTFPGCFASVWRRRGRASAVRSQHAAVGRRSRVHRGPRQRVAIALGEPPRNRQPPRRRQPAISTAFGPRCRQSTVYTPRRRRGRPSGSASGTAGGRQCGQSSRHARSATESG